MILKVPKKSEKGRPFLGLPLLPFQDNRVRKKLEKKLAGLRFLGRKAGRQHSPKGGLQPFQKTKIFKRKHLLDVHWVVFLRIFLDFFALYNYRHYRI